MKNRIAPFPFVARAIFAALLGVSWQYGHWGPVLSLLLIPLVVMGPSRRDRYGVALAYYLAGSHGLILGSASFFGPGHVPMGVALWLASSVLLAAGWVFADRPWRVLAVLLIDALPPLGLFDWLSPLANAGVLFPALGIFGLLAWLLLIYVALHGLSAYRDRHALSASLDIIPVLLIASLAANMVIPNETRPVGWMGMDLHLGPITRNIMADMARNQEWISQTQAKAGHHRVVLLPETLLTWWAGNAAEVKSAVPMGQTWLVGASVPVGPALLADGIEEVRGGVVDGKGKSGRLIFVSPFPVPVSMWHPWYQGHGYVRSDGVGYEAGWWEPIRKVDGVRAWASICYDQLLPWVWAECVAQDPQVVLLTNNEWWADGTGIPEIQRATAWAWTRLIGSPVVEAENAENR
ncbi:carbon-nitrogen hydrolase family protein [Acidithiobacillus ferridurans]|nr:conjugal transfer protein TraB [Acidithiobacillus ferridurans]MBU2717273.1 conjugal transfer protein TraB [Acidithiobacillus ferridurans]MBU2722765.1 conjugal transfer protein TraB [Acidithiobacillus ferridurans]MBU2726240.1 conjugal transfer protein TraB [Acidithiobacillus ferridurans]